MKLKSVLLASVLATTVTSAYAGNYVNLTSGNGTSISAGNGGIQNGANAVNGDKFYIETTSAEYLTGFEYGGAANPGNGEVVATSIDYRTFATGTGGLGTTGTGTLTLLDWQVTRDVPLLAGVPQADIFDFVYRDSSDGKLVFGTRYLNFMDNNQEANYLYRAGFAGYTAAAAWTFSTDYDLRMYQAGFTSSVSLNAASFPYDPDVVRQKGDFSVSEGNPWSGLFLVKTNAEYYTLGSKAIGYFQAGEEGQAVAGGFIGGFVASSTPPVTPVPEPETYGMMLAGLALMGFVARRRRI